VRSLEDSVRKLLAPQAALLVLVAFVACAALFPSIEGALNVHATSGALALLGMLLVVVVATGRLLLLLPGAVRFLLTQRRRSRVELAVVVSGVMMVLVFGGWLAISVFGLRP
jgi:hypothetical protein